MAGNLSFYFDSLTKSKVGTHDVRPFLNDSYVPGKSDN